MKKTKHPPGFSLVELILVMMLLATIGAMVAPSLSKSFKGRNLTQESLRFYALTEYARDEAASQGIPMVIWIDSQNGKYGLRPRGGYPTVEGRSIQYTLNSEIRFSEIKGVEPSNEEEVIVYSPSGWLDYRSAESIELKDQSNYTRTIAKTQNGWGYEILKETEDHSS